MVERVGAREWAQVVLWQFIINLLGMACTMLVLVLLGVVWWAGLVAWPIFSLCAVITLSLMPVSTS
jgi:hypothetical protein